MRFLFHFFILTISTLAAETQAPLQISDIHKVMDQMLSQHYGEKTITTSIIKSSFKSYISQFDPDGIYLLNDEVQPFLHISDAKADLILLQYNQNNFSEYKKLQAIIQNSIKRAKDIRSDLETNERTQLFSQDKPLRSSQKTFAENTHELRLRIKRDIIQFILSQKEQFGEDSVNNHQKRTMSMYENEMKAHENEYLVLNETMFATHVLKALSVNFDAHTKFFNTNEAYDLKVKLEKGFPGIGVELQERPEGVIIAGLVKDGPAEKSNKIKVNDLITSVDGIDIEDEPLDRVLEMLHGPKDSAVTLSIKRSSYLFNVTLKRVPIAVNEGRVETSYEPFDDGVIARLALHSFYQGESGISSETDVQNAIEKLKKIGNLKGLILDLRDNTGGFLMQAVKVAGLFISEGVIVVAKYSNGTEHYYRDTESKMVFDNPLIILTSKETASAAEIVTQALQDYGVALVVGDEHTFGKGTIQTQTITSNRESPLFKVTVGMYYTVSGKTPQEYGVKADVVVPSPLSEEEIGEIYLPDTLQIGKVTPSFEDTLKDIEPSMRPWYVRNYIPHLQAKKKEWRAMLPSLKKNSAERMSRNVHYQAYLKRSNGSFLAPDHEGIEAPANNLQNLVKVDLQLNEAVNILKDMILLHSQTPELQSTRS